MDDEPRIRLAHRLNEELMILARRCLLDALDALRFHLPSLILVGGQAVHLRAGNSIAALAPYTTDADLVVSSAQPASPPTIDEALRDAGFALRANAVGRWTKQFTRLGRDGIDVGVDLLVPPTVSVVKKGRSADLVGHHSKCARIAEGLDCAICDAEYMTLEALEETDRRTVRIQVAGSAALIVAKVFKIRDRQVNNRLSDKDAVDVYRLLLGSEMDALRGRFQTLRNDLRVSKVAEEGLRLLKLQFGAMNATGVSMAARALDNIDNPDRIRLSIVALVRELLHRNGQ